MATEKTTGRTTSDALIELLSAWRLLLAACVVLVVGILFIHSSAEPGTEVALWGIKYQKAKAIARVTPTQGPSSAGYYLPKNAGLSETPMPFLDGSLALTSGSDDPTTGWLEGANMKKIRLFARKTDGRPYQLQRYALTSVDLPAGTYLEVEYNGMTFAVTLAERREPFTHLVATVEQRPRATLDLVPVSDLPEKYASLRPSTIKAPN